MFRNFLCFLFFLIVQISGLNAQKIKELVSFVDTRQQKLSPELFQKIQQEVYDSHEKSLFLVSVLDISKLSKDYSGNNDFQILSKYKLSGSVQIQANGDWLKDAILDSNLRFIATSRQPFAERELTGFDLSVNKVNLTHKMWPRLNGMGSTISIKEQLMDTSDIDFIGRYLQTPSASTLLQTHATTMATIAAGGGNSFYTGKGVVWGANISNSDFNNLLPDNTLELQRFKVAVQNHSYGVGIENFYGADAAAYDAQMNEDTTILHVFSAGNFGNQTSTSGFYSGISGFANLTGSFKMAKNILTVGATDSFNNIIPFSSRGPAYDGRVKPELVALGEDGSSGAAAIVSGISLLIRDAWMYKKNTTKPPSSALIKAVILNSADEIGPPNIDFVSGYGSANAWRAIKTVEDGNIIQGKIVQSQINTHSISLPANVAKLKVTISWIDPPAAANRSFALSNDLDLELTHAGTANKYLPWVLNSASNISALQALAVRGRDSLNNAEQITVDQPTSGLYQIMVRGRKLISSSQSYSIAWQYDTIKHFMFTFPVKGNQLIPNKTNTIRWESTSNGQALLQYSFNGGEWETISKNIELSKNYYQWYCPNKIGAVQLRMISEIGDRQSDTVALAPIISAKTGFNCVDSFLLYWPKIDVNQFQVFRLGKQYLDPILITNDTLLISQKRNNQSQVYSVAPILPFNIVGLSGYSFNYTKQQTDCYLSGFIADPFGNSSAKLSLKLGTTYQVARVVFEKQTSSGFKNVSTVSPVLTNSIISTEEASPGLNIYRARVELRNGRVYYSKAEQVLIFGDKPYYLFPNPVLSGTSLKLMSEEVDDTVFILHDLFGRKIFEQDISSYIETINLPILSKGVYYSTITKLGVRQKTIPITIY